MDSSEVVPELLKLVEEPDCDVVKVVASLRILEMDVLRL